jgi:sugar lactone lactonase YvrE
MRLPAGLLLLPLLAACGAPATPVPPDAALETLWLDGDFTEGPAPAPDGSIYFSDIGNRILRFDPKSGATSVFREPSGKANGLMFDAKGNLLACEGAAGGNRRISLTTPDGTVRVLADRWEGRRFNSPNDLAVAPNGDVYFSDPRYGGAEPREIEFEGVFVVSPDGTVRLATRELSKPNGILVSRDGSRVYAADNDSRAEGNHHLVVFRVRPDGLLGDKRILHDFGPGKRGIDGMTMDAAGNVYATAGRGAEGGVYVFDPEGRRLAFIPTPGDPTNCVFGGPSDPGALYITAQGPPGPRRRYGLFRLRLGR